MLILLLAAFAAMVSPAPREEPLLVSVDEAARMLGVSRRTVIKLINDGTLRSLKIGRRRLVLMVAVRELIAERLAG